MLLNQDLVGSCCKLERLIGLDGHYLGWGETNTQTKAKKKTFWEDRSSGNKRSLVNVLQINANIPHIVGMGLGKSLEIILSPN